MRTLTLKENGIKFRPGAITKDIYNGKTYLVTSLPIIVKSNQQIVTAIEILPNLQKINCPKLPHLIVPSNLATSGIICTHQEWQFDISQLEYIEELNGHLLNYITNICK